MTSKNPRKAPTKVEAVHNDDKLTKVDGRYYAVDSHGGGFIALSSSETLWKGKPPVNFAFPALPALFLSLARREFDASRRVDPRTLFVPWHGVLAAQNATVLFDYLENLMGHVVFSFNAVEAFANAKIPEDYVHATERKGMKVTLQKAEVLSKTPIEEKLCVILPSALKVPSPKGSRIWERFVELKRIRDRITHPKPEDYTPKKDGAVHNSLWGIMMQRHDVPYCDYAHDVIGHFGVAQRWFRQYPKRTAEAKNITDD